MKKVLLCLALIMGLSLYASASWAVTPDHEAQYLWFYNPETGDYGTLVDQLYPYEATWVIGDISGGETIAQVREKFWILEEGWGHFSWTVWNDESIIDPLLIPWDITSFAVSHGGFTEPEWVDIPPGWYFDIDEEFYIWSTELGNGIIPGQSFNRMQVIVPTDYWVISYAGIDYEAPDPEWRELVAGESYVYVDEGRVRVANGGLGLWRTSHPGVIPEPGSMALLGLGLLGFGSTVIRKRVKA